MNNETQEYEITMKIRVSVFKGVTAEHEVNTIAMHLANYASTSKFIGAEEVCLLEWRKVNAT